MYCSCQPLPASAWNVRRVVFSFNIGPVQGPMPWHPQLMIDALIDALIDADRLIYYIYIDVFLSDNGLWCSARRKHEDPSSPQALKPSLSTCETLQPLGSQSRVSVQVGCSWSPRPGPSLSLLMRYVRYVHSSEFRFLRIYLSPCRLPMQHLMQYSIESQRCTVLK